MNAPARSSEMQALASGFPPCLRRLADHAAPETLLITCTDPVLDTCLLDSLRQEPLLLWRCPGPVVPPLAADHADTQLAIDHAVRELRVKEVVVCGHVPGQVLQAMAEGTLDSNAAGPLAYYAQASLKLAAEMRGELASHELQRALVEDHLVLQLANLRTYPAVTARMERGELSLHAWVYDVVNGRLYGRQASRTLLLRRLYQPKIPSQGLRPVLDPTELYLA